MRRLMIFRWMHRAYAFALGYFWLPCPRCGRMFGGHEKHGQSVRTGPWTALIACEKCA